MTLTNQFWLLLFVHLRAISLWCTLSIVPTFFTEVYLYLGHKIGDHSFDHMSHNNPDGGGMYDNVDVDFNYFGQMNLQPLLDLLREVGFPEGTVDEIEDFFYQWIRLPNDNNWRLKRKNPPS